MNLKTKTRRLDTMARTATHNTTINKALLLGLDGETGKIVFMENTQCTWKNQQ